MKHKKQSKTPPPKKNPLNFYRDCSLIPKEGVGSLEFFFRVVSVLRNKVTTGVLIGSPWA